MERLAFRRQRVTNKPFRVPFLLLIPFIESSIIIEDRDPFFGQVPLDLHGIRLLWSRGEYIGEGELGEEDERSDGGRDDKYGLHGFLRMVG